MSRSPGTTPHDLCADAGPYPRSLLVVLAALALAGCSGSLGEKGVRGYLQARGYTGVLARMTNGSTDIDEKACGGGATLYAFASDQGAGVACSEESGAIRVVSEPVAAREGPRVAAQVERESSRDELLNPPSEGTN